jgi:hypothetical protein
MRNPLRTGAAIREPAPLAALSATLESTKSQRVLRLESAARVAADERAEAARIYKLARDEAQKLQPVRSTEMPGEREARLALEAAEKRSHEARWALREARAADLPDFQRAIDKPLAQLVAPLSRAADLIDGARAVLGEIDNYSMRNGISIEPLAPRLAGTALLRREIARLPGGQSRADRARAAVAAMSHTVEKANNDV